MSASFTEDALREYAAYNILDANVRVGPSGVHGVLALEAPALLEEMDRFAISRAVVSHFTAEEYDPIRGNLALQRNASTRFVSAWCACPDAAGFEDLKSRRPKAARLWFGAQRHNFSPAAWCAGEMLDYLQQNEVLTLISREEIDWPSVVHLLRDFPRLRVLLLDIDYRSDRYLFPLLRRHPNLFFDSAMYVAHRQLEAFVESFGAERIVFGSRLPLYTPGAALAVLASARIPDYARLAISGGTLRRLLGESS
ncbi:MAG: amidohydrolase family protein [Candidatus Acidiferrales bacterium]